MFGETENRLVLFRDGTYLELIAFVNDDPEKRRRHWWDKPFGVVDFALTTKEDFDHQALNERLKHSGTGISYDEPREGGRKRPDGTELRWKVTFPKDIERGAVPFWCHDLTPRECRVPVDDNNSNHPCGALGMAGVAIQAPQSRLSSLNQALLAIVDGAMQKDGSIGLDPPEQVEGAKRPSVKLSDAQKARPAR